MGRAIEVPITPSVLAWAIKESGIEPAEVARSIDVDEAQLARWVRGEERPNLTAFKKLAQVLRRPSATFLLPRPPKTHEPHVAFRHPPGVADRDLLPEERLRIREVHRVQRVVGGLLDDLGESRPALPSISMDDDPERVGGRIRDLVGATTEEQTAWLDMSAALRAWRRRFEELGVLVFLLPMGADGARGFSLWDDAAPAIVINTHWNTAARIYTLFHELAHLLTRTNSICVETTRPKRDGSDLERWCERVAAAALMPADAVRALVDGAKSIGIATAKRVAAHFRVSLRAAALRLINLQLAGWPLFRSIPASADGKAAAGGGAGRDRPRKRFDEYGRRATFTFVRAVKQDVISASEAMRYLDVGDRDLDELEKLAA